MQQKYTQNAFWFEVGSEKNEVNTKLLTSGSRLRAL